jgi:arylsulfatase
MASQKQPNILIIWGDDIGWFNVSAYNLGCDGLPHSQHRPRS